MEIINDDFVLLFVAGAVGALVDQLVHAGTLEMPRRVTSGLFLGFVGAMVVGGFVGIVVDGSYTAAALSGYVGISMLKKYVPEIEISEINRLAKEGLLK